MKPGLSEFEILLVCVHPVHLWLNWGGLEKALEKGAGTFAAGKLGELKIDGDSIILAMPVAFTRGNIDDFDFQGGHSYWIGSGGTPGSNRDGMDLAMRNNIPTPKRAEIYMTG